MFMNFPAVFLQHSCSIPAVFLRYSWRLPRVFLQYSCSIHRAFLKWSTNHSQKIIMIFKEKFPVTYRGEFTKQHSTNRSKECRNALHSYRFYNAKYLEIHFKIPPKIDPKWAQNEAWTPPGSECETWSLIPLPQGDFWTPNELQRVP